jgi:hypothetical protein
MRTLCFSLSLKIENIDFCDSLDTRYQYMPDGTTGSRTGYRIPVLPVVPGSIFRIFQSRQSRNAVLINKFNNKYKKD